MNANNQREINIHLPWSNGRIYWDAGGVGGYDRIDQAASANQYEGEWHHWAFTKDVVTETMAIYFNGAYGTREPTKTTCLAKWSAFTSDAMERRQRLPRGRR